LYSRQKWRENDAAASFSRHFHYQSIKMSIEATNKWQIMSSSPIINHAINFGVEEALYSHRDWLKGDRNRHRTIKRIVEQNQATTQYNIVEYALKHTPRKALKMYPNFFPGDSHRTRKLSKAIELHKTPHSDTITSTDLSTILDEEQTQPNQEKLLEFDGFVLREGADAAADSVLATDLRAMPSSTSATFERPCTTSSQTKMSAEDIITTLQVFPNKQKDITTSQVMSSLQISLDIQKDVHTTNLCATVSSPYICTPVVEVEPPPLTLQGGGVNLFLNYELSTVVDKHVIRPNLKRACPPRLRPSIRYEPDTLPDFPIWFMNEDSRQVRFLSMADIHREVSWNSFKFSYVSRLNKYNIYVSGGLSEQREAIHAYNFPIVGHREALAPDPNCVAGMSTNRDGVIKWFLSKARLAVLFDRLIGATGINAAMVLVPKSPLSIFNAFASSYYGAVSKGAAKTDEVVIRACINWLLNGSSQNAYMLAGGLSTLKRGSSQSQSCCSKSFLDVWCEAMSVPTDTHDAEKVCRMRKHLKGIGFRFDASYSSHFPVLNDLFVKVLCEIYKSAITVLDNASGSVLTYRAKDYLFVERTHLIMLKVEDDEFYGVINLDTLHKK
jgi:hypothetical protein